MINDNNWKRYEVTKTPKVRTDQKGTKLKGTKLQRYELTRKQSSYDRKSVFLKPNNTLILIFSIMMSNAAFFNYLPCPRTYLCRHCIQSSAALANTSVFSVFRNTSNTSSTAVICRCLASLISEWKRKIFAISLHTLWIYDPLFCDDWLLTKLPQVLGRLHL